MKYSHKIAVGAVASLALGLAVAAAYAQPGGWGGGMGQGMMSHMGGGGMMGGMGPGAMGGMGPGAMGGQQLMTPEERQAHWEKMRSATTPEERRKIAEEFRAEMQKRAKEKGVTFDEHHGMMGYGPHSGYGPSAPATK